MGIGSRLRGKTGKRMQCDFLVHRVFNLLPGASAIRVSLRCSNKTIETKYFTVEAGEVEFNQTLKLITTIYSSSSKVVDPKTVELLIKESRGGRETLHAQVAVNIADFVPERPMTRRNIPPFKVGMRKGTRELPTHMHLSVNTRWLADDEAVPSAMSAPRTLHAEAQGDDGSTHGSGQEEASTSARAPLPRPAPSPGPSLVPPLRLRTGGSEEGRRAPGILTPRGSPRPSTVVFAPDESSVPALRGTAPDLDTRTVSAYTAAQVVRVVVGGVFHSTVQVLDNYGAPMRLHRDAVVVVIEEPGGGELPEVHVSDAFDDGRFAVDFMLQQPGIHTLGMIVNGKAITQSEVLIEAILGESMHESNDCCLSGDAVAVRSATIGAHAELLVQSRLYDYGQLMSGDEKIQVTLKAPSGMLVPAPIKFADGQYKGLLCWPETGSHKVSVAVNGKTVPGSPFFVNVIPQTMCLPLSRMFGEGLYGCVAGKTAEFTIQARDCHGTELDTCDPELVVVVEDSLGNTVRGKYADRGYGLYAVTYKLTKAGNYNLSISLHGTSVQFQGTCEPGPTHVPSCVFKCDPEHGRIRSDEEAMISITRKDAYGNQVFATQGLTSFVAKVTGPGPASAQVIETINGSCSVNFSAHLAGLYRVHLFGGKSKELLPGCPIAIQLSASSADVDSAAVEFLPPARCLSDGLVVGERPPTNVVEKVSGAMLIIELNARDRMGNPTTWEGVDASNIVGQVTGRDGTTLLTSRMVAKERMHCHGSVTTVGVYTITLREGERVLPNFPKILQVTAAECNSTQSVFSLLSPEDKLFTRSPILLSLQGRDYHGNRLAKGGDMVGCEITLDGAKDSVAAHAIQDHSNGTYTIEVHLETPGRWTAQVFVDTQPTGKPVTMEVRRAPLRAEDCVMSVLDCAEKMTVYRGVSSTISVHAANSNCRIPSSSKAHIRVVAPSGVLLHPEVGTGPSGALEATVCWHEIGSYTVYGSLEGAALHNSPMSLICLPSARWECDPPPSSVMRRQASFPTESPRITTPQRRSTRSSDLSQLAREHTSAAALTGEVALRDGEVHCRIRGLETQSCVAGEKGSFTVDATDTTIGRWVAKHDLGFEATLNVKGHASERLAVEEKGHGTYQVSYVATVAGCHNIVLVAKHLTPPRNPDPPVVLTLVCLPAEVDLAQCEVDASAVPSPWIVGEWATFTVVQKDRFGNLIEASPRSLGVSASGDGPGPVTVDVDDRAHFACLIHVQVQVGGHYEINVFSKAGALKSLLGGRRGRVLKNCPFMATTVAAPACASECLLVVLNSESMQHGINAARVTAGEVVSSEVICRDKFGNMAAWGERASVQLAAVNLDRRNSRWVIPAARSSPSCISYSSEFTTAGTYRLLATVDGEPVGHTFSMLQVLPSLICPEKCTLDTRSMQVTCFQVHHVKLQLRDAFGNSCVASEDVDEPEVAAKLVGFAGVTVQASVAPRGGECTISFQVPSPGQWELQVTISGTEIEDAVAVAARYGSVDGRQCVLDKGLAASASCGTSTDLVIKTNCHPEMEIGWSEMTGREIVSLIVTNPSNLKYCINTSLSPSKLEYAAALTLYETGVHTVSAWVNQRQIQGSPFRVEALAEEVYLPYSSTRILRSGPNNTTRAGEEQTLELVCKDRLGNVCSTGGFVLKATVLDFGGSVIPCHVHDMLNGTYQFIYNVCLAGSYTVELSSDQDWNRVEVEGLCIPGKVHFNSCVLDSTRLSGGDWFAGAPGVMSLTRCDQHGNLMRPRLDVSNSAGTMDQAVKYVAKATGPGPVAAEIVEVGDGSMEVRLSGRVPGYYSISVLHHGHLFKDCPFTVELVAGRPSESSCITSISGIVLNKNKELCAAVGGKIRIDVEPRDRFGNTALFDATQELTVDVVKHGVPLHENSLFFMKQAEFSITEDQELNLRGGSFTGEATSEGRYTVWLQLNSRVVAGWPRIFNIFQQSDLEVDETSPVPNESESSYAFVVDRFECRTDFSHFILICKVCLQTIGDVDASNSSIRYTRYEGSQCWKITLLYFAYVEFALSLQGMEHSSYQLPVTCGMRTPRMSRSNSSEFTFK